MVSEGAGRGSEGPEKTFSCALSLIEKTTMGRGVGGVLVQGKMFHAPLLGGKLPSKGRNKPKPNAVHVQYILAERSKPCPYTHAAAN